MQLAKTGRNRITRTVMLSLALFLALSGAASARWMTMPDGVKMNVYDHGNQNWPRKVMLFVQPPMLKEWSAAELGGALVDDTEVRDAKAAPLERGKAIAWKARFPRRSIYQISIYARSVDPAKRADRVPTYLTLRVGDRKPILMQTNFHTRVACIARFLFHVDAPGEQTLELAMSPMSDPNTLHIERVRLTDQLANCAGRAGKTTQVLYSAEAVERLRAVSKTAASPKRTAAQWTERYEAIWRSAPSPWLPIIHNGGKLNQLPNPKTGAKAKWDIYPNLTPRKTDPYHVTDLNTRDVFPTNNYAAGELTGGAFPDNGWGWFNRARAHEPKVNWSDLYYPFVAWHTGAGHPYQKTMDSWPNLCARILDSSRKYLESGDDGYAREATVGFAVLAYRYPQIFRGVLDYDHVFGTPEKILFASGGAWYYGAWQARAMRELATAYDQIFPFVYPSAPDDVIAFLGGKMPWVKTGEDLRALIETNLLQYPADQCVRRHLMGAEALWESCLATLAAVQQDTEIVTPWLQEMWTRCMFNNTNQGGLPDLLTNGHMREGANLIGQVNYAMATAQFGTVAHVLHRLREAGGPAQYDLSDMARYPKLLAVCAFPLRTRAAGGFLTQIGEGYTVPEVGIRAYPETEDKSIRDAYALAWRNTANPSAAWYLRALGRENETDAEWTRIETAAKACVDPWLHTRTRQLPGFGLTVLESGSEADDITKKAALFMLSSIRVGHAHADTLDIELIARGARIVPDLATRYARITYKTRGHNCVEVDGRDFVNMPGGNPCGTGWIDTVDEGGWVRFTQASARAARQKNVGLYRRAAALVDTPEGAYFVDVFRVRGGNVHTWNFHTQYTDDFAANIVKAAPNGALAKYVAGVPKMAASLTGVTPEVLTTDYTCRGGMARDVPAVRVRTRLFGAKGLPVAVGEESNGGKLFKKEKAVKFLFVRREGQDLASRWLHVIEPYGEAPILKAVEELPVPDADNAAALAVTTAAGRKDLIVYNDTGAPITAGPAKTDALFSCAAFAADGTLQSAYLLDGTELSANGWALKVKQKAYTPRITAVDPVTNTLTLDTPLPPNSVGRAVSIGALPHKTSFDIAAVDGNTVRLAGTARTYQAKVLKVEGRIVTAELQLVLKNADPDYYIGMAATNGKADRWWTVTATPRDPKVVAEWEGKRMPTDVRWSLDCRIELDKPATMDDFPVVDGRPMVMLYDFGPGAALRLPASVSIRRNADGKLTADNNVNFTLTRPDGGTVAP